MSIKYSNTEQIVSTDVANKLKSWNDLNPVHQITFNIIENLDGNKSKVRFKMPYGRNLFTQKLVFFLTEALTN